MTGPSVNEAAVIRAILRYRESVAEATAQACRELRSAGVPDPGAFLLRRWTPPSASSRAADGAES